MYRNSSFLLSDLFPYMHTYYAGRHTRTYTPINAHILSPFPDNPLFSWRTILLCFEIICVDYQRLVKIVRTEHNWGISCVWTIIRSIEPVLVLLLIHDRMPTTWQFNFLPLATFLERLHLLQCYFICNIWIKISVENIIDRSMCEKLLSNN